MPHLSSANSNSKEMSTDRFQSKPKDVTYLTNFFNFKMKNGCKEIIHKYDVKFLPEIEPRHQRMRMRVFNKARAEIKKEYNQYVYEGDSIMYSTSNFQEAKIFKLKMKDNEYTITIQWVQAIERHEKDFGVFYGVFVNHLLRRLNLKQIGRKHFDTSKHKKLGDSKLCIMPGYSSSVGMHDNSALLNLDVSHRVLRDETALDIIRGFNDANKLEKIKNQLEQTVVLTTYNNSTYTVTQVVFSMSPKSTFPFFDRKENVKKEISYLDYYKKMYDIKIKNEDQPLLENCDKKTKRKIYLIPELWKMTGITDEHRKDFRLMKEMAKETHKDASRRMEDIKKLFTTIQESDKCQMAMKEWNVKIDEKPIEVTGYKLPIGNFLLGLDKNKIRTEIKAEGDPEIDRKIQQKMYEEGKLK